MVHSTAPGFWRIHPESPPVPERAVVLRHTHTHTHEDRHRHTHALTDGKTHTHTSPCTRRLWLTHFLSYFFLPFSLALLLSADRHHRGRLQVGIVASPWGRLTLQSFTFLLVNSVERENKSQTWNGSLRRCLHGGKGERERERSLCKPAALHWGDWHCWKRATCTGD